MCFNFIGQRYNISSKLYNNKLDQDFPLNYDWNEDQVTIKIQIITNYIPTKTLIIVREKHNNIEEKIQFQKLPTHPSNQKT